MTAAPAPRRRGLAPWYTFAFLGLFLMSPGVAWATVEQTLEQAVRLLQELEDEQAAGLIQAALSDSAATPTQRARLHALLGLARLNLHDEAAAREEFKK